MRYPLFVIFFAVMILLVGCQSMMHPGSSSLAFVEIQNTSLESIHDATIKVFVSEQYDVLSSNDQKLVFIREGSSYDRLQYGRYEERLQMKVVVTLEAFGDNKTLVRADAYAVIAESDRGAVKLMKIARRPYQKLLEEVKASSQPNREAYHILE